MQTEIEMATAAPLANEMINTPAEATGEYKEMLVRLLTRQIYAETATSEVFGKAITAAPNWQEKELAAEFAAEKPVTHGAYMTSSQIWAKIRKQLLPGGRMPKNIGASI